MGADKFLTDTVVFASPSDGWGGAEACMFRLASEYEHKEIWVTDSLRHRAEIGFPTARIKKWPQGRFLRNVLFFFGRMVFNRPSAVVIHLPWVAQGRDLMTACVLARVPCMTVVHLVAEDLSAGSRAKILYRWLSRYQTAWISVCVYSARAVARFTGLEEKRINVVLNGVDVPRRLSPENRACIRSELCRQMDWDESMLIGMTVGRLHRDKCCYEWVELVEKTLKGGSDWNAVWVGDGPERENWIKIIEKSNCKKKILWLGQREDVNDLLQVADFLLVTSRLEACPLVILQAIQVGLPIVSTAVAGIPEIVTHGKEALFGNGDQLNTLEPLIHTIVHDEKMRNRMSAECLKVAQKWTADRMVAEHKIALKKLLEEP